MIPKAYEPPLFEWTQLGPVPVELEPSPKDDDGNACDGYAMRQSRRLAIDSSLTDLATRLTLAHEWVHFVLYDSGWAHRLGEKDEELLADTLATALVAREDFHANGGVPEGEGTAQEPPPTENP